MLNTLRLQWAGKVTREPVAWFFPACNFSACLEELARCELATPDTRIHIVPKSLHDRSAAGFLVVPQRDAKLRTAPSAVPCGLIAGRLFLPIDALLSPPVSDAEIQKLIRSEVAFFHPALGLSGFDAESALQIWDLLEAPGERSVNWNFAQAAPGWPVPFRGIALAQLPSLEMLFSEESQDIGSKPFEPLPPAPDEPRDGKWAGASREARRLLAKVIAKLASLAPHTGTQRTWLNDIEDWAHRQMQSVGMNVDQLRNKELHRLLHMLRTQPEEGLRHAIPFNDFGHRGRSQPGAKLGSSDLNFDVNNLGGRAADFWDVDAELRAELTRQYRELADRETRLGRHRRAAYIYAHLLGDLVSAANVLKGGGHYRDAAVLYEQRLNNPVAAAECLAEGGLLREAAERFEKLGDLLRVAGLYEKLGENEKAAECLRRVVKANLANDDVLAAAHLLETRLQAADEAAAVLDQAWPKSRQAVHCLRALFDLHARRRHYEIALERMSRLRAERVTPQHVEPLSKLFATWAVDYPDPRLRESAHDGAQILVARELSRPRIKSQEALSFVQVLTSLAPQDRLLARDGNRYVAQLRERENRAQRPSLPTSRNFAPKLVRAFELPRQIQWLQMRASGRWFFAAGCSSNRLTLIRGVWEGDLQSASWRLPGVNPTHPLVMEPADSFEKRCIIFVPGREPLPPEIFPAADLFFSQACTASTPSEIRDLYPVAVSDQTIWSMHIATGKAVISCYDLEGTLLRSLDITSDLLIGANRSPTSRVCLAAFPGGAAVALGDRMVVCHRAGETIPVALPGEVTHLIASAPHTRATIVALLQHGAVLNCVGIKEVIEIDRDGSFVSGAWTGAGSLVLITKETGQVLDVDSRGVHGVKRFSGSAKNWLTVTAAGEPDEFAVFDKSGQVSIFKTS